MVEWACEGEDWIQEMTLHLPRRMKFFCPPKDDETAHETFPEEDHMHTQQETDGIGTLWFSTLQEKARRSSLKSGATARRWWTGSMVKARQRLAEMQLGMSTDNCLRDWWAGPSI